MVERGHSVQVGRVWFPGRIRHFQLKIAVNRVSLRIGPSQNYSAYSSFFFFLHLSNIVNFSIVMHQWTKSGGLNSTEQAFLLPTNQPRVPIQAPPRFFRITALRSNPSSTKQWISQMQLAVTSRAKYVLQKMSKERNPKRNQERPKIKKKN